ncbi:MAG: cytochrome c [Rhodocyclales bacterium]|nr:cytochrome c [Rhodocyclales bacterium]
MLGAALAGLLVVAAPAAAAGPAGDGLARQNYIRHCAGCHRFDGGGNALGGIPSMKGAVGHFLRLPEGRAFLVQVPGTSQAPLGDAEIAELLNWILVNFSSGEIPPGFSPYSPGEVAHYRESRLDDVAGTRQRIVGKLKAMGVRIE